MGNPPYQMQTNELIVSASMIYGDFIMLSEDVAWITSIIHPLRWIEGNKGTAELRDHLFSCDHVANVTIIRDSATVFPNTGLTGGLSWEVVDSPSTHDAATIAELTPDGHLVSSTRHQIGSDMILLSTDAAWSLFDKVNKFAKGRYIRSIVYPAGSYGSLQEPSEDLLVDDDYDGARALLRSGTGRFNRKPAWYKWDDGSLLNKDDDKYVDPRSWKIFISEGYLDPPIGRKVFGHAIMGRPGDVAGKYIQVGSFSTREEAACCMNYILTRFFRWCVTLRKIGVRVNVRSFDFVPMIDFRDPRLQRLTIDEMDAWLNDSLDLSVDEVDEINHLIAPWSQSTDD